MAQFAAANVKVPSKILSDEETVILAVQPSPRFYYTRAAAGSVLMFLIVGLAPTFALAALIDYAARHPAALSLPAPAPSGGPAASTGPDYKTQVLPALAWLNNSHVFLLTGLALAGLYWAPTLLRRMFSIYVLTDQRLIKRVGVLAATTRYTPLAKVQDITVSQDLAQRVIGCGDLKVSSAGAGHQDMVWACVDRPYELAETIRRHIGEKPEAAARPAAARVEDPLLRQSLVALRNTINRLFEEGYVEWSRKTLQDYWKSAVPLTDAQVQAVFKNWERAGIIRYDGREDCYITVLKPFPTPTRRSPGA